MNLANEQYAYDAKQQIGVLTARIDAFEQQAVMKDAIANMKIEIQKLESDIRLYQTGKR